MTNLNFPKATPYDTEGNEIRASCNFCKKPADHPIMSKGDCLWYCTKCLYGDAPVAKFVYREPDMNNPKFKMAQEICKKNVDDV